MAIMDRVRRGEHDLTGVPDPLRGAAGRRPSTPIRATGPTMSAILGWLRPQVQHRTAPVPPPPAGRRTRSRCRWRSPRSAPPPTSPSHVLRRPAHPPVHRGADRRRARRRRLAGRARVCPTSWTDRRWPSGSAAPACWWPPRWSCRRRRRGVPLARQPRPRAAGLGAPQRLARRQRGGRPAPAPRQEVVRRRAVPAAHALGPGPLDPGHVRCCALERRAGGRGGADLLRVRRRRVGDPRSSAAWCSRSRRGRGPGGSRVRSPLGRVVGPLSRTWQPWAAARSPCSSPSRWRSGMVAESFGSSWAPGDDRPLSGPTPGQSSGGRGTMSPMRISLATLEIIIR